MADIPRLIEHAFPLKQASLDSVHEKNVRHGHISTLHIWPARRPLAACRAALIATLLPDPGTPEARRVLCEKIGGKVVKKIERKKMPNGETVEREKEITEGGILHWGLETEKKELLEWFRQEIRKAYGGRAPKVLDPFAGGGAIPLEAMRLGCEATAVDINPVAWFILKCTLEYPQKLAGKTWPLPEFIIEDEEFMDAFYKAHPDLVGRTKKTKRQKLKEETTPGLFDMPDSGRTPKADLAWHVRAWGRWVLDNARRELARFYPTYADFKHIPLTSKERKNGIVQKPFEKRLMQLVPIKKDGTADIDALNAEFSVEYLEDKRNPRWMSKPTVAYLWARTVKCKNCRATIPLLKTRWLCKKKDGKKRVLLTMEPNASRTGVVFGIETNVPAKGGNAAQSREHDRHIGTCTMSRSGVKCPCCATINTLEDIGIQGKAAKSGFQLYTVVVDGPKGKEYRKPTELDARSDDDSRGIAMRIFQDLFAGPINEQIDPASTRSISVQNYGLSSHQDLYTNRQMVGIGTIGRAIRATGKKLRELAYTDDFGEAIQCALLCVLDKLIEHCTTLCTWNVPNEQIRSMFARFSLGMAWDFAEVPVIAETCGSFGSMLDSTVAALRTLQQLVPPGLLQPTVVLDSAINPLSKGRFDLVFTDPPYYQAISYADLSDVFYVWLRRILGDKWHKPFDMATTNKTAEIVQHIHPNKSRDEERAKYEQGMYKAFIAIHETLTEDGRAVIVFAHKDPLAWATLVGSLIRAGFVVNASWPIQTERVARTRALATAALASSVWLVCKKRSASARPGWDNLVLEDMRRNIRKKLREFWDAGIRGPDFVWAATGPALEAYSKHPVVKKANDPGQVMPVSEFLTHVRRMVVDFVVGRVLSGEKDDGVELSAADRLDEPTAYYLLHRHDFGMDEAPAGACILYAISCGVSDKELSDTWDLIGFTKGKAEDDEEPEEADADVKADTETEDDSGSNVKLKTWAQRKNRSLGFEAPGGRPVPLIDRVHCLMHLWKAGDVHKVDEYLDENGLRRQELFKRLLQSLIELSPRGSEERSLLESLSNHVGARGAVKDEKQILLFKNDDNEESNHG